MNKKAIKIAKWISGFILFILVFLAGMWWAKFDYTDTCLDMGGRLNPRDHPICVIRADGNKAPDNQKNPNFLHAKQASYSVKLQNNKYYHSLYNKINDQFFIGSMTKVFTATLIFYLGKKGKLSIEDRVEKYVKLPRLDASITIKDLLSQTSGLRDDEEMVMKMAYKNQKKSYSFDEMFQSVKFTNDKTYKYANINFVILGEIIKKVSGKSFNEYVNDVIVKKLKLKNTCSIFLDKDYCHPQKGYMNLKLVGGEDTLVQLDDYTSFYTLAGSAGNLVSSVEDLDIFLRALVDNVFFDFKKMTDNFNKDKEYLYGIQYFGEGLYGHSGQTLDSTSLMFIDPKTKKTVIILTADSSLNVVEILNYFRQNPGHQ